MPVAARVAMKPGKVRTRAFSQVVAPQMKEARASRRVRTKRSYSQPQSQ